MPADGHRALHLLRCACRGSYRDRLIDHRLVGYNAKRLHSARIAHPDALKNIPIIITNLIDEYTIDDFARDLARAIPTRESAEEVFSGAGETVGALYKLLTRSPVDAGTSRAGASGSRGRGLALEQGSSTRWRRGCLGVELRLAQIRAQNGLTEVPCSSSAGRFEIT
jgi:hypothetical protein